MSHRAEHEPMRRERLWEIDALRTVALILMVVYHVAWNIDLLSVASPLDAHSGGWRAVQVACGSLFLFVSGLAAAVATNRARARGLSLRTVYRRQMRRILTVAAAALLVSVATLVALGPDRYVRFGVLHCIVVAMLIAPVLVGLRRWLLPLAASIAAAGFVLAAGGPRDIPWLLPLGVPQSGGAGVDWYPLTPWLAPVLIGLLLGGLLYPDGARGRIVRRLANEPHWTQRIWAPGRHTLGIYLIHQPLLLPLTALGLMAVGVEIRVDARG
ncbi:MAG TPA: heparan-alpha-glucosaminide N-acetyltransferase [Miltoncostaeaceae bacterium]|nr:heparan-alpha-glucosaminide N-acetyltransferase [Miltoncostaeaceae bacterium]